MSQVDTLFADRDKNEEIHEAIIRGNLEDVQKIIDAAKEEAKKILVEMRNYEGKSALMLSIEHERDNITTYLLDTFADLDLEKQDVKDGNASLHIACLKENIDIAARIMEKRP